MYGMIFEFLREYVIEKHGGKETWRALVKETTGNPHKIFFPVKDYPDEALTDIAVAAANALSLPLSAVLEDFGTYVGPRLVSYYSMYVKGNNTSAFHIIDQAGSSIHDAIHRHNPDRKPPLLYGVKESDEVMMVHYKSHRKLCPVVKGIIRGLGEHFGETLSIQHTQCIHRGADECIFRVERKA